VARHPGAEKIYKACERWRDRCLVAEGSVFTGETLWTANNLDQLEKYYVLRPEIGSGAGFFDKLRDQLEPATDSAKQLAAEIYWLAMLFPSNTGSARKVQNIQLLWSWSGSTIPADNAEMVAMGQGIGSGGPAYNFVFWREFAFGIVLFQEWRNLDPEEQRHLISAPWDFAAWLDAVPQSKARQFRHMLLHLVFPDSFERMSSSSEKKLIETAFAQDLSALPLDEEEREDSRVGTDKRLLKLHQQLELKAGTRVDFYEGDLRTRWRGARVREAPIVSEPEAEDLPRTSLPPTTRENILAALATFDNDLRSSEAWNSWETKGNPRFALQQDDKLYPPKQIISMVTGIPRKDFSGGSQANRYLESYGFRVRRLSHVAAGPGAETASVTERPSFPPGSYSIEDALDGLFMGRTRFVEMLGTLRRKRNIVLQGSPGVGKTFVARRLAYALMGVRDASRIEMIQFHQSYSYEDFVQGWRPNGSGFELRNGVFHEFCRNAEEDSEHTYVFVIDEINRGNLSKILGELMLLIEADKRGPEYAIPLTYSSPDSDDRFFVPTNVFIVGLMNTADRSLALVDYALRRRFGFITLEPEFGSERYREHLLNLGAPTDLVDLIVAKLTALNTAIADDKKNLGPGFEIGHSFFTPSSSDVPIDTTWYRKIVADEVGPLLREYWFDSPSKAADWIGTLLG
jgi:hypothetical protein